MEVVILHQTVADGDAVGHDIEGMYQFFTKAKIPVFIYCEYNYTQNIFNELTLDELKRKISLKDNIVLYHHSIYWPLGEDVLKNAKCRVIIRYHNITPPKFFDGYSQNHFEKTKEGLKQTKRLAANPNYYWLHDSYFNCSEILELGVSKAQCGVMAPFNKVEYMDGIEADYNTLNHLVQTSRVNAVFIGRVATNKGHMKICNVAKSYRELYGDNITFWIVGGFDQELTKYNNELNEYIRRYGLESNVIFTQKVSIQALKSYILGCDVFICLSEHEGFCVPLIEAQYYKLPVVTWDNTAIKETIGKDQLVFASFDPDLIASAIYNVATNKDISSFLIEKGIYNYTSRFTIETLEREFEQYLKLVNAEIDRGIKI